MTFVKLVKNKAYFRRYQVKYRRRREGRTDYTARRHLVIQDKNKYNTPKYRLVARVSNEDVIAQITAAKIDHDEVVVAAYSHELPRYGVKAGLTNYASCYCTGLLLARRLLKMKGIDSKFAGVDKTDGEEFHQDDVESARPFRAVLDIGLARSTTGARVFAVMKGASDGGIFIPHNMKRFPGFNKESGELDASILRKHIMGGHVADYMRTLQEEGEEKYVKQFSRFIAAGIEADGVEKMYEEAHAKIRESPLREVNEKTRGTVKRYG
jgi:large subunit ribosomal protein L5e